MKRWYVIHTHPHGEKTALTHLIRQGFQVFWPRFHKRRSHARRVDTIAVSLFPRYLFVRLDPENTQWRCIRSTMGVANFVSTGDHPCAVPDGVVEELLARQDHDGLVDIPTPSPWHIGDKVRVLTGPFVDFVGSLANLDDNGRVTVLFDMLGRRVNVAVPTGIIAHA